ncbi:proton-conducting transporter membrane subunit [Mycobacterium tuberculosis]
MHEEQDMRRYGGLRAALPVTFATFGLAYLAIIGVPPFAGFSGDAIIEAALAPAASGACCWRRRAAGAGVTAFYMTRVMLMTFFGEKALDARRPSARGTGRDDLADDLARRRLGVLRWPARGGWHVAALAAASCRIS